MPNMQNAGKLLIVIGIIIISAGILFLLIDKLNITWLGRLPGDIYVKKKNFRFYFPLGTSIIISIILSLIFYLISIFFRR